MEKRLYKKAYGQFGNAPDFARCCESVTSAGDWWPHQCNRKRGYGPDKAYCKQHDPAAVKARRAAQQEKYNAETNKLRYQWNGRKFYNTLKLIAEGHNDARGLAQDVLAEFHKGERK